MGNILAIIAFMEKLRPFIPLAAAGARWAQAIVGGGLGALRDMIENDRAPTTDEWADLRMTRNELLRKLNSDTE